MELSVLEFCAKRDRSHSDQRRGRFPERFAKGKRGEDQHEGHAVLVDGRDLGCNASCKARK